MKKQKNLDQLFVPLSKIVIILPIVIIVVSLFFKATDQLSLSFQKKVPPPLPTVALLAEPTIVVSPAVADTKINLDLNGSYNCSYQEGATQTAIHIKNKQIYGEVTEKNQLKKYLLKGDCAYEWQGTKGDKVCGMSQLVGMYEVMTSFGIANMSTLLSTISQSGYSSASDEARIKSVINTCKKGEVSDSMFILPKSVIFKASDSIFDLQK